MTETTEVTDDPITLQVETADLRQALRAVAPFAFKDIDDLSRIRVTANSTTTALAATNGSAAGLALVSTIALDAALDEVVFDLSPGDAKKILEIFPGKAGKDDQPGDELRVDVDAEHITVTDASGMFEGQQLVLPRTPMRELTATVQRVVGRYLHAKPTAPQDGHSVLFGPNLALFIRASTIYGSQLMVEHHQPGPADAPVLLIRVGESFIGSLVQTRLSEDEEANHKAWREAWTRRIAKPKGGLKAVHS